MEFGQILAIKRREAGLNQSQLADRMGEMGMPLSNQAISKWEKGTTLPNVKQFFSLCKALDIEDINGLFLEGGEGVFRGLNSEGRRKALDYIALLRESGRYSPEEMLADAVMRRLPLYSLAVSAGTGQFLDGEDYEMVEVGAEVPEGANFGVRVSGDSMEPEFHDGDTVWVRQQRSLMTGEIGIFLYDGSAYLKELVACGDRMALHSLNEKYNDIIVSPELPLRVLGKVLK